MKILITGGAGYVGSVLVDALLARSHEVTILDRMIFGFPSHDVIAKVECYRGDVRDPDIHALVSQCDAIVHLAFASNDPQYRLDPAIAQEINIGPIRPLLRAAAATGVRRFVFLSSCSVYGQQNSKTVDELTEASPNTDYARHKLACEDIIKQVDSSNLPWVILRPATVCGLSRRQRFDLLLNRMVAEAVSKGRIVVGSDARRPCVTISDLVSAIEHVLVGHEGQISGHTFNVVSQTKTVHEWAHYIRDLIGCDVDVGVDNKNLDRRSYSPVCDRLLATGFKLESAVRRSIEELAGAISSGKLANPLHEPRFYNLAVQEKHDFVGHVPLERCVARLSEPS